jgi:hypothetical protein
MTTKTTMTRTIRLAIGTAAVLALMAQAAQAKPIEPIGSTHESPTTLVGKGTYMPVSPANNVAAAHAIDTPRGAAQAALGQSSGSLTSPTSVTVTASADGFDWAAAFIGASLMLAPLVLIGAVALTARGRRRVPLSA